MNNYIFQIIIFVFVNCVRIFESTPLDNITTTSTLDFGTSSIIINTELPSSSMLSSDSSVTISSSFSYSTSTVPDTPQSTVSRGTDDTTIISSTAMISSTEITSIATNTSVEQFSSSATSNSSAYITSKPVTSSINIMVSLIYKYVVESLSSLTMGNIYDTTVLISVQKMVNSSFNLTNFDITVTSIEITSKAKVDNNEYDMITNILFKSSRTDCNVTCIKQSASSSTPTQNFTLLSANGSLVNVAPKSSPTLVDNTPSITTTTAKNYRKGESPPGVAAQLGMGFGITIIGILLIGEIIYFYRKYGLNGPMHHSNYAFHSFEQMSNSTSRGLTKQEIAIPAILGTIVYIGGFIGNLLSLTIFIRTEIRRVSTGLLFLLLTISNSILLLTLIVEFIDVAYNVRLFHFVFIRCCLVYWLQNVFRSLSSFIACTISLDRMFRAVYPARAKYFCTCRLAYRIVFIYTVVFTFSLGFYLFPYMGEDSKGICSTEFNPIYHKFMTSIWPLIRTFLVCILPVAIMIVANIRLWRRIQASKRRVAPHTSNHYHSTNTERMLLFIAISNVLVFIITQIPFHMYASIVRYKRSIDHVRTPMLLWSSLYFGIGFYIYCLTSRYFRSKFISTVYKCLKKKNTTSIRQNTISQRVPN
ncbi:unnamed protein product [Rotaria sp. Silwood2]|nr:unnamed protein product [Rotaria sp. Silwood2]